ncbi:hypothetical protein BOTBODRAFT_329712 [Botryobasidium botryosum FD-172 SS1]|uniref:Uncharacterized protein n=1 Tax=Botryobasidium botryosum (strain FD-172 SS1) TaxID=930990 RepID=A0A067MJC8_BOTB1|nr:hypothetical protein BOTBODRAFT_329712 [Botryobasidium botryosum FD-172 SS1]
MVDAGEMGRRTSRNRASGVQGKRGASVTVCAGPRMHLILPCLHAFRPRSPTFSCGILCAFTANLSHRRFRGKHTPHAAARSIEEDRAPPASTAQPSARGPHCTCSATGEQTEIPAHRRQKRRKPPDEPTNLSRERVYYGM